MPEWGFEPRSLALSLDMSDQFTWTRAGISPSRHRACLKPKGTSGESSVDNFKVVSLIRRVLIIERHLERRDLGWVGNSCPTQGDIQLAES